MSAFSQLSEELLKKEYVEWFKSEFSIPPVITSSTGWPAVRFAQHCLKKFEHLAASDETND